MIKQIYSQIIVDKNYATQDSRIDHIQEIFEMLCGYIYSYAI